MNDKTSLRERYLQDDVPIRLGGIAANLQRVKSFLEHKTTSETIVGLLEESSFFIEWTAAETELDIAAELVELQVKLARWRHNWKSIWADANRRHQVAEEANQWSGRVLKLSGLLG